MLDIMYEAPSDKSIKEIEINKEIIEKRTSIPVLDLIKSLNRIEEIA
ncbi:MAG: hypothetical protein KatS3mg068_0488 [Candidatus Sericytochromatia bacterium]|nr:MAG: hypothetical protein KatS3mg068_0488 [Candidatus Sericytochromatia bacterium]